MVERSVGARLSHGYAVTGVTASFDALPFMSSRKGWVCCFLLCGVSLLIEFTVATIRTRVLSHADNTLSDKCVFLVKIRFLLDKMHLSMTTLRFRFKKFVYSRKPKISEIL